MQIIFLGTNGWYDSPTGNTICTLINSEECHVILDAGNCLKKADRFIYDDPSASSSITFSSTTSKGCTC